MERDVDSVPSGPPVQADPSLATAHEHLKELLVPGELLEATSAQVRLFALTHRRFVVAATSTRFIGMSRGLIGGFTPVDVRWQDLHDVSLHVGVFAATLTIRSHTAEDMAIAGQPRSSVSYGGLKKSTAQAVYRICQAQEQAWREKRRIRELEELRAKSGGIHMAALAATGGGAETGRDDAVQRLAKAKEMLEKGLINDAEYEGMKARIIAAM